jgi:uncharacterized membrane protein (UPF0127 family)
VYVVNQTRGTYVGVNIRVANSFAARLVGLYAHRHLPFGDGVWLVPCNSIQTVGLGRAIDCIFLARDGGVVRIIESVRPWRVIWPVRGAYSVMEVPAGVARSSETQVGDRIQVLEEALEPVEPDMTRARA